MAEPITKVTITHKGNYSIDVKYKNSQGAVVTYAPRKVQDAKVLFPTVDKYFTNDDPNITPQEQISLRTDFAKKRIPLSGKEHNGSDVSDLYTGLDFVLDTFTREESEGGKNITPKEVYTMYEIFHTWTK